MRHLSKSTYLAGLQCTRRLWWEFHEPDAPELQPDMVVRCRFDEGLEVGRRARQLFSGGVLIESADATDRVSATREAMASGAAAIFEGTFEYDGTIVRADVMERLWPHGWSLIEVKSSTKVKPEHRPDVAVQLHVLRGAGVDVRRVELMHLNRECRCPDFAHLFEREDLTTSAEKLLPEVGANVALFKAVCRGTIPDVEPGLQCCRPYECPFIERCHEDLLPVPSVDPLEVTVKPGLSTALKPLQPPIAFLDFETVNPAIPVWDGCRPYDQVPVQVSVHLLDEAGNLTHREWLAGGIQDPRREMADRILEFTEGANAIVVYYQPFEEGRIRELQDALPSYADDLELVRGRLFDLLPVVRDHVEHPRLLGGGFGLKNVLPVLVPDLSYDNLEVAEGGTASAVLRRLVVDGDCPDADLEKTRGVLLDYCCLDTMAMVRVHERLKELTRGTTN